MAAACKEVQYLRNYAVLNFMKKSLLLQGNLGIPVRPVPELRAFNTLQDLWDVWDKGSQHQPALRALEEEHGNKWRKDQAGSKANSNSKRWCVPLEL